MYVTVRIRECDGLGYMDVSGEIPESSIVWAPYDIMIGKTSPRNIGRTNVNKSIS